MYVTALTPPSSPATITIKFSLCCSTDRSRSNRRIRRMTPMPDGSSGTRYEAVLTVTTEKSNVFQRPSGGRVRVCERRGGVISMGSVIGSVWPSSVSVPSYYPTVLVLYNCIANLIELLILTKLIFLINSYIDSPSPMK